MKRNEIYQYVTNYISKLNITNVFNNDTTYEHDDNNEFFMKHLDALVRPLESKDIWPMLLKDIFYNHYDMPTTLDDEWKVRIKLATAIVERNRLNKIKYGIYGGCNRNNNIEEDYSVEKQFFTAQPDGNYVMNLPLVNIFHDTNIRSVDDVRLVDRLRLNPTALKEKYGDNIVYKFSRTLFFIEGKGLFNIPDPEIMYRRGISPVNNNGLWIYLNSNFVLSDYRKFLSQHPDTLNYFMSDILSEDFAKLMSDIDAADTDVTASNAIFEYFKQYLDEYANTFKDMINRKNRELLLGFDNFKFCNDGIKEILNSNINAYKDNVQEQYRKYLDTAEKVMFVGDQYDMNNETKAMIEKGLDMFKRYNFIDKVITKPYGSNNDGVLITIHCNLIPVNYFDHEQFKQYVTRSGYIPSGKSREDYMNVYEDKYKMWLIPSVINILCTDRLYHGFYNSYNLKRELTRLFPDFDFSDNDFTNFLVNGINRHSTYGGYSIDLNDFGSTGCLGTFSTVFSDAENNYNLAKEIYTVMQYISTLVPYDGAGNYSINNAIITDETGKIVRCGRENVYKKLINKYRIINGVLEKIETKVKPSEITETKVEEADHTVLEEIFEANQ